jgi:hypothetical protein
MPPRPRMRPVTTICGVLVLATLIAGCGDQRAVGDPGGVPVEFAVRLESAFLSEYHRGGSSYVGFGVGHVHSDPWHHHHPGFHDPWDPWWGGSYADGPYGSTPTLLAGDGPSQGQLFRRHLSFGDNRFTIPVRAGRTVTLTFQVDGDYQGWETLGEFVAADRPGQVVTVSLTRDGVKLAATAPADVAPLPLPPAPARP